MTTMAKATLPTWFNELTTLFCEKIIKPGTDVHVGVGYTLKERSALRERRRTENAILSDKL
jgi:hypothetical protein